MRSFCYTSFKRTLIIVVVSVLIVAVAVLAFVFMLGVKPELLDKNRVPGLPSDLPEEQGYRSYSAANICDVALCGNPLIDGKEVKLYLTNPASNDVWIRAEIYSVSFTYDLSGKVTAASPDKKLGESGFIKPGEYLESVCLSHKLEGDDSGVYVMIKIATYIEETATSNGFFYVNTVLFP